MGLNLTYRALKKFALESSSSPGVNVNKCVCMCVCGGGGGGGGVSNVKKFALFLAEWQLVYMCYISIGNLYKTA